MTSPEALHASLLRPAIIHILRAAGFHSARPTVIDTLSDLCGKYLLLLASEVADSVYDRTSNTKHETKSIQDEEAPYFDEPAQEYAVPTVTDVRLALSSAAFFNSTTTASEEVWRELLRRPLRDYPAGARAKERLRRDAQDTRDIQEFLDWIAGPVNKDIRRIAGILPDENETAMFESTVAPIIEGAVAPKPLQKDNFFGLLKKKHSKTGDEARYLGTVLGKRLEEKTETKIEGGAASLAEWRLEHKRQRIGSPAGHRQTAEQRG